MEEMEMKFGECCICETPCIWLHPFDGVYYETETCCYVCLEKLLEELKEKGEVEGKQ